MKSEEKDPGSRRVTFKKSDYEKFAKKLDEWSCSLSPEERALLTAVLDKGSQGIGKAGPGRVHTATTVSVKMESDFDLGQFIVELLLAFEGVTAEVSEDGPSWIQEGWRR